MPCASDTEYTVLTKFCVIRKKHLFYVQVCLKLAKCVSSLIAHKCFWSQPNGFSLSITFYNMLIQGHSKKKDGRIVHFPRKLYLIAVHVFAPPEPPPARPLGHLLLHQLIYGGLQRKREMSRQALTGFDFRFQHRYRWDTDEVPWANSSGTLALTGSLERLQPSCNTWNGKHWFITGGSEIQLATQVTALLELKRVIFMKLHNFFYRIEKDS